MKKSKLTLFLFLSCQFVFAQSFFPNKPYRAWVYSLNGQGTRKGLIHQVKDSSIIILPEWNGAYLQEIDVRKIRNVKIQKKGRLGKSIAIGALSGLVAGIAIGIAAGDDNCGAFPILCFSAEEKSAIYGTALATTGGLIGLVVGSMKISFPIHGRQKSYGMAKKDLQLLLY